MWNRFTRWVCTVVYAGVYSICKPLKTNNKTVYSVYARTYTPCGEYMDETNYLCVNRVNRVNLYYIYKTMTYLVSNLCANPVQTLCKTLARQFGQIHQ